MIPLTVQMTSVTVQMTMIEDADTSAFLILVAIARGANEGEHEKHGPLALPELIQFAGCHPHIPSGGRLVDRPYDFQLCGAICARCTKSVYRWRDAARVAVREYWSRPGVRTDGSYCTDLARMSRPTSTTGNWRLCRNWPTRCSRGRPRNLNMP